MDSLGGNDNDYGGYTKEELCVPKKYDSYKEELLEHFDIGNLNENVIDKANEFMRTSNVKKMTSNPSPFLLRANGQIPVGTPIKIDHIISIICYCDMTDYSTAFSETFRRLSFRETVQSVRRRNSEYWWQSKFFKEAIENFGKCGVKKSLNHDQFEAGPFCMCFILFFTCNAMIILTVLTDSGLNCVLPIPQFNIRLFAPTSTSKYIEVATRFSGDDGMIITFNNDIWSGCRFFDCSWISRFLDEDERVFVNGTFPLRVQAVRITATSQRYTKSIESLFLFDYLLSNSEALIGHEFFSLLQNSNERLIFQMLCNEGILDADKCGILSSKQLETYRQLVQDGESNKDAFRAIHLSEDTLDDLLFDDYIISTFNAYRKRKTQIAIYFQLLFCMMALSKRLSKFYSVIVEEAKIAFANKGYIAYDRINLLSTKIFDLLPNVKSIVIETRIKVSGSKQIESYLPFSLGYFLENIMTSTSWNTITINYTYWGDKLANDVKVQGWISKLWHASSLEIQHEYNRKNLDIKYILIDKDVGPERQSQYYKESLIITRRKRNL